MLPFAAYAHALPRTRHALCITAAQHDFHYVIAPPLLSAAIAAFAMPMRSALSALLRPPLPLA